jgi:hypothetical protein
MTNIRKHSFTIDTVEYIFYSGKNDYGNFEIINNSDYYDIWFHIKGITSTHVILHIPNNFIEDHLDELIKKGAEICKLNTKLNIKNNKKNNKKNIEITYTEIGNIEIIKNCIGKVKIKDQSKINSIKI